METDNKELGAMIEKLMKDPQVASLVKNLKSETEAAAEEPADPSPASADAIGGVLEKLGPILGTGGGPGDTQNRNRLLSALKPYLNKERRDMIDKVTSISSLTSILDPIIKGTGK